MYVQLWLTRELRVERQCSCRVALFFPVVDHPDSIVLDADTETAAALPVKGGHRATGVLCVVSVGCYVCTPLSIPASLITTQANILNSTTRGGGVLVTGHVQLTTDMGAVYSALTGINIICGLFSTMAINMPVRCCTN